MQLVTGRVVSSMFAKKISPIPTSAFGLIVIFTSSAQNDVERDNMDDVTWFGISLVGDI